LVATHLAQTRGNTIEEMTGNESVIGSHSSCPNAGNTIEEVTGNSYHPNIKQAAHPCT